MVSPIKFCAAFLLSLSAIAHSQELTIIPDGIADETPAVTSLKLIGFNDTQDMVELQGLASGQTLDLAQFNVEKVNVMADVEDESKTGSVHFTLSGPITINRWENNAIFTMEVETDNLNIQQQEFPVGNYTLTVTPYELADMEGQKGIPKTVTFTVTDSKTMGAAVPPIAAAELVAVDDATGSFNTIRRLTEGSTISVDDMNFSLVNIVAISENTSKTASVLFELDGPVQISHYENETDFTLADKSEHLKSTQGDLPEGDYTLIVTPFSEANAQGEAGVPLMLNFTIGDEEQAEEVAAASVEPLVYDASASVKTASGFTAVRVSADSKRIYVSSSLGDDQNSCLSEASPCKSIKAGLEKMRTGYPDHLYLKRGDVWRNENLLGLNSGRSVQEPAVIAYYGLHGARPKLENAGVTLHVFQNTLANVHIMGLEFSSEKSAAINTAAVPGRADIALWGATENILFEDNKFSNTTVIAKAWKNAQPGNIHLRRNIWVDDSVTAAHLAKLHLEGVRGLLIEENVFNYSANKTEKREDVRPLALTISNPSDTVTLRGNIIVGSSGQEEQLFPGAITQNNFITAAGGTNRFNAFLDAVSSRPLGFWNDRYSSSAIDIYMHAG
jgi:hypothetical protein